MMEIQPSRAIMPSGSTFVSWGVRGSILATLIPLFLFVIGGLSAETAISILGIGAVAGGAVPAAAVLLTRVRRNSLGRIERELERARMMMERRLINEDDYQRIKSLLIEQLRQGPPPVPDLWPIIAWGALAGMEVLAFAMALSAYARTTTMAAGIAALAGGVVVGGAAQVYALIAGAKPPAQLPAPQQNRRLLGQ